MLQTKLARSRSLSRVYPTPQDFACGFLRLEESEFVIFHCPFCSLHASSRVSLSATPTRWTNVPVPPRGAVGRGLSRSRARTCLADARPRTRGGGGDEENTQLWPLPPPSARASPAVRAFSFSSTAPWLTATPDRAPQIITRTPHAAHASPRASGRPLVSAVSPPSFTHTSTPAHRLGNRR